MRISSAIGLLTLAAMTPGHSLAESKLPIVVELFTSQGCSSCPPADRILTGLVHGSGIVALAYHVDYWDYIGWQDVHGSRENTERQRAYAKALGRGGIYRSI